MDPQTSDDRLSRIKTLTTLMVEAHKEGNAAAKMRNQLLLRYYGAAYRYLLGITRDQDVADELTHKFVERFLEGKFKGANAQEGLFRNYLKKALRNMANDYWEKQKKEKDKGIHPIPDDSGLEPADPRAPDHDEEFNKCWRAELLARVWEGLARVQEETGTPYDTVLRTKALRPDLQSEELANQLRPQLGKPVNAASVRQMLHRARKIFADLLVEEVGRSLQTTDPEQVQDELVKLNLLEYCKSAMKRLGEA